MIIRKKKLTKIIYLMLSTAILIFIWITEARSCIIAAILFIILKFIPYDKYNRQFTFMVILFPLIFAIVYLVIINNSEIRGYLEFAESEGKTLTSRVAIWERAIDIIKDNLILGNYNKATDGTGMGQLHNIHLDTLAAYGIPTFITMIIFLNKIVNTIGENIKEKYQLTGVYAFYAVIIAATFEAALFSGSQGVYVFSGVFLMIAKYDRDSTAKRLIKIKDDKL